MGKNMLLKLISAIIKKRFQMASNNISLALNSTLFETLVIT